MSVIVTAGHNASDPGASGCGYVEANLAIEFRDLICVELQKMGINPKKDNDKWSLLDTIKNIFTTDNDVCLDIHWNASDNPKSEGVEIFVADDYKQKELDLARKLVDCVHSVCGFKKRVGSLGLGIKKESESARKRLGILRSESGINVLIETCFISNPKEMAIYQPKKKELALKVAQILASFYKPVNV